MTPTPRNAIHRHAERDTPTTVSMYDMGDNSCNPGHPDIAVSILTLGLHCMMNAHMVDRWVLS